MTEYFKIVFKMRDGSFKSACYDTIDPMYSLPYSIGSKTEKIPNSLGIFVFSELEEAKKFANIMGLSTILTGTGTKSEVQSWYYSSRMGMIREFYYAKSKGIALYKLWFTNKIRKDRPSTVFLDDFTPTGVVK